MTDCVEQKEHAISLYTHQNQLMWSRLQTMQAIQAGVLGAASTVTWFCLSWIILVFGAWMTFFIFLLILRDEQLRSIAESNHSMFPREPKRVVLIAPLKGREIVWFIFTSLILADVGLYLFRRSQHIGFGCFYDWASWVVGSMIIVIPFIMKVWYCCRKDALKRCVRIDKKKPWGT